jgi:hypothetical protein
MHLGETVAAAAALSAALGGARVELDGSLTAGQAAALGDAILAGLGGPGLPFTVAELTARTAGEPAGLKITVGLGPAGEPGY